MLHGWSSADAQRFIHGPAPFSSCFSPSVSFLRANGAVWGLSLGGGAWREPRPQRVAAINGAGVRKQPASYPGNPRCVRGTAGGLDAVRGNSDKSWEDLVRAAQRHVAAGTSPAAAEAGVAPGLGGGCQGSRGSIAGCGKEGQPHGGCSAHFHVFSAFFPSRFLSALAGSCAGAHLRWPQPLGSPTRC